MASLTISTRGFPPLAPLHQDHRAGNQDCRPHKTEWLQGKPEPMKHEKVAESHGYGGHNDDEEGAIHDENFSNISAALATAVARVSTACGKSSNPFCHSERSEESLFLFAG